MLRYISGGESHGSRLVCILEGLPAGVKVSSEFVNAELKRRQSGYGRGGRMKIESDRVNFISGIRFGETARFSSGDTVFPYVPSRIVSVIVCRKCRYVQTHG